MSKLKINRVLTANFKDPYEAIQFKTVKSAIKNADGSAVSVSEDLIVPAHWSDIACDILSRNYFRKKGVPNRIKKVMEPGIPEWLLRSVPDTDGQEGGLFGPENDARMLFNRIAGAWTYWGVKGGYFSTESDAKNFYDEMRFILAMQIGAPNSPQWFNTGLHWAYGIEGPSQGHFYFDEMANCLKRSQSAYERPQPHACFILSIKDDLVNDGGIMDLWKSEARIFKYGSGAGTNFSGLRGKGEALSGGGFSSGLMSFLKIGDVCGGCIKSGGTTRRAAKMVIADIDHPDIEEFITWKSKEENKVIDLVVGSRVIKKYTDLVKESFENKPELRKILRKAVENEVPEEYLVRLLALLENGQEVEPVVHTLDWETGAYASVFGKNANNSVRVTDTFLHAVENDADFDLLRRTDGHVHKTLKARYLWDEIAKAAWSCADPGMQYHTTINAWHTCANDGPIRASNPCSEYMFLDDTGCNLASLNLCKFLKEREDGKQSFDAELFKHVTRLWTIVLEISIFMAQFPTAAIAQRSYEYRTLGLGYGNLGALLMQVGVPYDSQEGRNTAAGITALMQGICYETSIEMAQCLGAFVRYDANKDTMMRVIRNHAVAAGVTTIEPFSANEKMELLNQMGSRLSNQNFFANISGIVCELEGRNRMLDHIQNANTKHIEYENLNVLPQEFKAEHCVFDNLAKNIQQVWKNVVRKGEIFGFRNANVSVIAPTGTIGLVMNFKTTGIEPQFSHVIIKSLAGGGVFTLVNDEIAKALKALKYTDQEIQEIEKFVIGHKNLAGPIALNENWLKSVGFLDSDIQKVNDSLRRAFSLRQGFNHHVLPAEFYARLGIAEQVYRDPDFDLLKHFGATSEQIEEADQFCCGHMTVEGAPHLKPEHLPVFDCTRINGDGSRCLSYDSHIKMMAAVQPFLSGAISKTINMPNAAKIEDCKEAYMLAWKLGLKAVALYRDKSKYSQILNTKERKILNLDENSRDNEQNSSQNPAKMAENTKSFGQVENVAKMAGSTTSSPAENVAKMAGSTMSSPAKLEQVTTQTQQALHNINSSGLEQKTSPKMNEFSNPFSNSSANESNSSRGEKPQEDLFKPFRRRGYTQHVLIGGNALWHTTGEDETGKLRNILLTYGKEGSTLRGWAGAWGRILSMYLQEKGDSGFIRIYKAFKHSRFEPMGLVQGHPYIKHATSIPDYIVEDLAYAYPDMLVAEYRPSTLPAQRNGKINKVRICNESMYIIIGEDDFGRPCEVFVTGIGKEGSDLRGWMSACAKLISIYFQDCPDTAIWQFIHAFEGSTFEPSGFIEGHPAIRSATSPLDFLAKHLRYAYSHVLDSEQMTLPLEELRPDLHAENIHSSMVNHDNYGQNSGVYEAIANVAKHEQNGGVYEAIARDGRTEQNSGVYEDNARTGQNGGVFEGSCSDKKCQENKKCHENFLGQDPESAKIAEKSSYSSPMTVQSEMDTKIRQLNGYKVDEPCQQCKSFRLRYNGSCYVCDNCFSTTGCS